MHLKQSSLFVSIQFIFNLTVNHDYIVQISLKNQVLFDHHLKEQKKVNKNRV